MQSFHGGDFVFAAFFCDSRSMRIGVGGLLLLGMAGLLLTVGGVATVLVVRLVGAEAEQAVVEQHRGRTLAVAEALEAACGTEHCDAALAALKPRAAAAVAVIGARGQLLGGQLEDARRRAPEISDVLLGGTANWAEVERPDDHARGPGVDHLVARPVKLPSGRAAVVMLFPLDGLRAGIRDRQRVVLGYLSGAIVTVLLFGFYLAHRAIAAPLRDLTARAEAITVVEETPWPAPAGPREVARLSAAFGEMVTRLRIQHASLAEQLTALEAARDELVRSEKLATVGRLAAGVAHEVGNPLAAVMGYVEYLRGDADLDPAMRADLLERVDSELKRISGSVRDLLDFSRPGAATPAVMDLESAASEAKALIRIQKHYREIQIDIEGTAAPVMADPVRIRQVFLNLFLNAADAMGGEGVVRVTLADGEDLVRAEIHDAGPGIDAETADRLFEPFFSTKPRGQGTGMGLAVSQRLVEEAGGRLWLLSEPAASGSVFAFELPKARFDRES